MKKIAIIAAIAALTTLAACDQTPAPPAPSNNTTVPTENTGGPCGDGTVLGENEQCK
jgi:hypothetical protein